MTGRRPSPDPKRPRDTRPPTKPAAKPQQKPKLPPRSPKGLVEVGRVDGLVFYRAEYRGAIAAVMPELSSADYADLRRLLPPIREAVAA